MKKRSFWLITALMTIALVGVVVMQLYYIREAYNLNSELFEQNVNQALNAMVNKVQRRNAVNHINKKDFEWKVKREKQIREQTEALADLKQKQEKAEERRRLAQQQKIIDDLNRQDSMIRVNYLNPAIISESQFVALGNPSTTPLNVEVSFGIDANLNLVGSIRKIFRVESFKTFTMQPDRMPDSIRYLAYSRLDGRPVKVSLATIDGDLAAKFKKEDATSAKKYQQTVKYLKGDTINLFNPGSFTLVEEVAREMQQVNIPLTQRISKNVLNNLIKTELLNRNIALKYDFWLKLANKDSLLYRKVSNPSGELLSENTYKTILFSNDVLRDPGMLYINFPDKNVAIFNNMSASLASSAGLLLILIFIFSYTLYAILKQKKISEMKTDFINNMTHEFKTPVATIMIASEALKDVEMVEDRSKIRKLAGIIYDENVRLGNHIERVLSIARLEKKELRLEKNEIDINELITAVADSMGLQLQKKNAEIILNLNAGQSVIWGDEMHLSNVIYNLIDNANKYSTTAPKIKLSTRNTDKNLIVEIEDHGIGITKDQTKRIFDQFYRVPTGNLHDVKGFGLGLNYVQDIVTQMNGTIKVHSEKDQGTTFEITLPLKQHEKNSIG